MLPPRNEMKPQEIISYLQAHAPPVYDPFSGGGSIPLEAQRLGLRATGSDLNPVAVLIGGFHRRACQHRPSTLRGGMPT
jgi:putative DNA methylase